MYQRRHASYAAATLLLAALPGAAWAQRASENALASADDAFGTNVGLESTGIYTENDTRGFSPLKAGNVRIDGIYLDPTGTVSGRIRASTAIRVGFASESFPFPAPTGIVDHKLRPYPETAGTSFSFTRTGYGGFIAEWDLRLPIGKHFGLTGGLATADQRATDASGSDSWSVTARPILRFGGTEFSVFTSLGKFRNNLPHPLFVVADGVLPDLPPKRDYIGQTWAKGRFINELYGATFKTAFTDRLSLRAGMFHHASDRQANFSVIFPSGTSTQRVIADPPHDIHSTSGEALLAWRIGGEGWQHRLIAGFRARNRYTESGGSDVDTFGADPVPEPEFAFSAINRGRVRQSSLMLGYLGSLDGFARVNLGVQKARYRAELRDGRTGLTTGSRDAPWLYNAMATVDLSKSISLYAGTERGLEDSGAAPENAANRNEQLPATRTTQYEGGLRWRFRHGQLVVNGFQITKPYFSFDTTGRFEQLGRVRHRGVEASFTGRFGKRLNLLAGIVAMQPRVSGDARDLGLVGERPAGTPSIYGKLDVNYRTDIFGGLTPTATLTYNGERAVTARPVAALGGKQLMLSGYAVLDLGLRQQFKIGRVPASFRILLQNVFDHATWKVIAANTLQVEERRRLMVTVAADF